MIFKLFPYTTLFRSYDFHAYWLAGRNLLTGAPLYPDATTILGLPDEFRYLPIVAIVFVPFALLPYSVALAIWIAIELAIAAAVGVALIRPLPASWRPWAAAGYVFFLGLVLEVTLGNVNLISLALALAAWRLRDRALPAGILLAAAVGPARTPGMPSPSPPPGTSLRSATSGPPSSSCRCRSPPTRFAARQRRGRLSSAAWSSARWSCRGCSWSRRRWARSCRSCGTSSG